VSPDEPLFLDVEDVIEIQDLARSAAHSLA